MKIKILIPVYNDWKSVFKVLDEINNLDLNSEIKISVIIINDASNHDLPDLEKNFENKNVKQNFHIIKNQLNECLIFLNSGGNSVNSPHIKLNDFFLNLLDNFDDILINLFPNLFIRSLFVSS